MRRIWERLRQHREKYRDGHLNVGYWWPGFKHAFLLGIVGLLFGFWLGEYGWGMILFLPTCIGIVLGWGINGERVMKWFTALFLIVGLTTTLVTFDLAGILCAVIGFAIVVGPFGVGVFYGSFLRHKLRETAFRHRHLLPAIAFVSPFTVMFAEHQLAEPLPIETIVTTRTVPLTPQTAWERMAFYEEIPEEPPALTRIGLPNPLYTEGTVTGVGDLKRCVYDKGYLVKRITAFEPGHLLAFDVIEQVGIEDRSIALTDGSFAFTDNGDGTTTVTLTTRYRPLLTARTFWRPFEVALTRSLHNHVLDGIEMFWPHASP